MKHVLITGGSGGIGQDIVQTLLATGYAVCNLDLHPLGLLDEHYEEHIIDLGKDEELQTLLETIKPVDALINNAVVSNNGEFTTQSIADVKDAVQVNLVAPVLLSQWFANTYQGNYGRIINISSTRARMSEANTIPYSVSKGAMEALTHSLAITLQKEHITVNAIAPGWIHHGSESLRDIDHKFHPSNRAGMPKDITRAVLFLLSEDSQFINGEVITIDGGVTKKMIYPE
jgi:NAD(P)-dependent dehydrogenase (short-subunit alcohol dehydrogenase family)